jgi:hypothetical protein
MDFCWGAALQEGLGSCPAFLHKLLMLENRKEETRFSTTGAGLGWPRASLSKLRSPEGVLPMRTMLEWTWTRDRVLDLTKLICGELLLASTWAVEFAPLPAWNLRVCGYASLTASLAALVAEADWEPRANLWLGVWVVAAPWALGFSEETAATLVHVIAGVTVSMLSAVEVWSGQRSPPWRFGPGAAQRAALPTHAMTVALGQTTSQPVTAVRRPIPLGGARFAASPINLRPFRSSGHPPARRLQVSAGTRRLGRRACARLRSALEHKTRQIRSPCSKHVSSLAQMVAAV